MQSTMTALLSATTAGLDPAALADDTAAVTGAGALDAESVSESSLDRPALPPGAVLPPEAPPAPVPVEGAALLLAAGEGTE